LGDTVAGFAGPPESPKPDISTVEKLKAALLSARRIAFSDPARGATVGTHFLKVIESLGIKDEVLKKSTLAPDGVETMRLVLEGKVDLGVTQTSEIVQANRAALVGPFPREFDLATTYSLWHRATISPAARGFAALITSPAGRAKLAEDGVRPPAQR
jgi:molybdate transport system substrate-binding protein